MHWLQNNDYKVDVNQLLWIVVMVGKVAIIKQLNKNSEKIAKF